MEQAGKRHRHHLGGLHQRRAFLPAHQARYTYQHELRCVRCRLDRIVQYELVVGSCEKVSIKPVSLLGSRERMSSRIANKACLPYRKYTGPRTKDIMDMLPTEDSDDLNSYP